VIMSHRAATRLAGGWALILAVGLSGCAVPEYTDVSDPSANMHVEIPDGWDQISGPSLDRELRARGIYTAGAWKVAYEPGPEAMAADFLSFGGSRPFVFVEFGRLTSTESRQTSYGMLRNIFLPVTSTGRQSAVRQGFPLTGFRQIRDQILALGKGAYGVRETYDYTDAGQSDTFDMDAVAEGDHTGILVVLVHCTTTCYRKFQTEIEHVMSSVTVSGPD